ncbi:MAG: coproporphyrinogen-III oxidase family protein [Acidobacteria bacterium]|nr:coproporphyrinogen-III oxidase family protein [Acidobacteriota bacterium]
MTDTGEAQVGSVFVSNYPPYSVWGEGQVDAAHRALDRPGAEGVPLGLYLHIPFCRKRCKFCYFKIYTEKDSAAVRRYLAALVRETQLLAARPAIQGRPLNFVYFGGGTPSYLSSRHLEELVANVTSALPWDKAEEITFECEPGTISEAKLRSIRSVGVTRLSLGVENFNDGILAENGRAHLSEEIYRVLPWIEAQGFDQLNIDLIAGMVGETWETWKDTVRRTVEVAPDSVTIYQMELPFNTVYSRRVLEHGAPVAVADWETRRAWQDHAYERLEAAGYRISSAYTMLKGAGDRFVYRDALWHGADLLGTGVASFSHVNGVHFQNFAGWDPYLEGLERSELPIERAYATSAEERLTRELILQLKMGRLEPAYFHNKFGIDIVERWAEVWADLKERGLAGVTPSGVALTRSGLLQVDHLLPAFYAPGFRNIRYT